MAREGNPAIFEDMTTAWNRWKSATVHELEIGRSRIAYRRIGRGPALVLVHGWPMCGATYRSLVDRLRESFTCYVPDLPGAGATAWDPNVREYFTDMGTLVHRFAQALELSSFGLLGHDSGGTIARIAASLAGPAARALVLFNTELPGHEIPLVPWFQRVLALPGAAWVFRHLLKSGTYLRSALGFGGAFESLSHLDGDFRPAIIAPLIEGVDGAIHSLRAADLSIVHRLEEIHAHLTEVPLLCAWGDADRFFPVAGAQAMVRSWRAPASLAIVHGRKLLVHEEAPDEIATHVRPFLHRHLDDCGSRSLSRGRMGDGGSRPPQPTPPRGPPVPPR